MADIKTQSGTVLRNIPFNLDANTFTRSGYKFLGWSLDKNASSPSFTDKQKTSFDKDSTLYAIWKKQFSGGYWNFAYAYSTAYCDTNSEYGIGQTVLGTVDSPSSYIKHYEQINPGTVGNLRWQGTYSEHFMGWSGSIPGWYENSQWNTTIYHSFTHNLVLTDNNDIIFNMHMTDNYDSNGGYGEYIIRKTIKKADYYNTKRIQVHLSKDYIESILGEPYQSSEFNSNFGLNYMVREAQLENLYIKHKFISYQWANYEWPPYCYFDAQYVEKLPYD